MLSNAIKLVGLVVTVLVVVATVVVLLDWWGIADTLGEESEKSRTQRLPAEFLYLDQERADAYLGQLERGLAPSETRTETTARKREAKIGGADTAQLGGSVDESEEVVSTVSPKAADRFHLLEDRLATDFGKGREGKYAPLDLDKTRHLSTETARLNEGDFVRLDHAQIRLPTYTLALKKLAHGTQFRSPGQQKAGLRVSSRQLAGFAIRRQRALDSYVTSFGEDPRLPFRLEIAGLDATGKPATPRRLSVFLPVRYSSLVDAPSLLTGRVTVIGKVIRKLNGTDPPYFDTETAAAYERATKGARAGVHRILAVPPGEEREVVQASATASAPALVVVPVAIYK